MGPRWPQKQRADLKSGESLVVLGASGGVGLAAVELGARLGARVIACASSDEKLKFVRGFGAAETINYATSDSRAELKRLTSGRGADIVYDPVGGPLTEQSLRSLAWMGRLLVIGFASGEIPKPPLNLALLKGCDIRGVFWGEFLNREPEAHRANMAELLADAKKRRHLGPCPRRLSVGILRRSARRDRPARGAGQGHLEDRPRGLTAKGGRAGGDPAMQGLATKRARAISRSKIGRVASEALETGHARTAYGERNDPPTVGGGSRIRCATISCVLMCKAATTASTAALRTNSSTATPIIASPRATSFSAAPSSMANCAAARRIEADRSERSETAVPRRARPRRSRVQHRARLSAARSRRAALRAPDARRRRPPHRRDRFYLRRRQQGDAALGAQILGRDAFLGAHQVTGRLTARHASAFSQWREAASDASDYAIAMLDAQRRALGERATKR